MAMQPGRRICVVGTSGAGKTLVAKRLAAARGLTYVCSDAILWRAGWQQAPMSEQIAEMRAATAGDSWTFDGNLTAERERFVFEHADTLVWLDLPRVEVFGQLLARTLRRCLTREPLWHGNRETLRMAFLSRESVLWWALTTFDSRRRAYAAMFQAHQWRHLRRIRLASRREVSAWLARHA